jgi:hypothetical protein
MGVKLGLSHLGKNIRRLRVFENRVMRIFGTKRDEVARGWRRLHNEELHNLYASYLLTPWCRILFEKLIFTQFATKHSFFMEPEGSLLCSQKPSTGPYPEPAESSSPQRFPSP